MPLVGAVNGHNPLGQHQILAAGDAVDAALVHIGQLQHGVLLSPEEEAPLFLVVEEGIHPLHLKPPGQSQLPDRDRQWLRLGPIAVGGHANGAAFLVGRNGKPHAREDAHGLVQVEILKFLLLLGHSQDAHTGLIIQVHGFFRAILIGFLGGDRQNPLLPMGALGHGRAVGALSQKIAVGCKRQYI